MKSHKFHVDDLDWDYTRISGGRNLILKHNWHKYTWLYIYTLIRETHIHIYDFRRHRSRLNEYKKNFPYSQKKTEPSEKTEATHHNDVDS